MDNAVVIGYGMVGRATMEALGINKFYSRSEHNIPLEKITSFKYIFICIPTPTLLGKQQIDNIKYYVKNITEAQKEDDKNIIIIRSTILPGTCKKLSREFEDARIVHVPEFLTESSWEQDAKYPDIVAIGSDDIEARSEVEGIFRSRYKTENPTYFITDSQTAEVIKYSVNCFYALKIVYANEIYDFCQDNEIPYETVKEAMYARKWIGKNHLDIWHHGGRGAGGKCLEKDLEAFAYFADLPLLEYANKINKGILMTNPKDR